MSVRPRLKFLIESPVQVGDRVLLRYPEAVDQDEFLRLRKVSQSFHKPWEPTPIAGVDPYSADTFRNYLKGKRKDNRERLLVCRTDDGAIVGAFNLSEIVRGPLQSAYLGYWVGAPFQRRGYMTDGIQLLLAHAFGAVGLHRIEANIRPENIASLALVQRAGFSKEGYSPRYLKIDGDWRDHERWAILHEDWHPRI